MSSKNLHITNEKAKDPFHIRVLKDTYRFKQRIKKFCFFKVLIPFKYNIACMKPIEDDKVVFLELHSANLSDSYKLIFNELIRNYKLDIRCHFLLQNTVDKGELYRRQTDLIKDIATAKYIIFNDSYNFTGALKRRKGAHIMNMWHACGAFKKFGFSTADKLFGANLKDLKEYPLHPDYDMVTVSSPEVRWAYIEAMGKDKSPECVKGIGVSRTDIFYDESYIDAARQHIEKLFPAAKEKKIILYAPTFRGHVKNAESPDLLDIRAFEKNLGSDYCLVMNHHPFVKMRPQIPEDMRHFAMDMTGLMSIDELIMVSDICISDYSSLVFEYSLYEKPIIFFAYDLENYDDWRGFYYKFDEFVPGPIFKTNKAIIDHIMHIDERFDKEKVHAFRLKFMSSCDGHATERIMKEFFGDGLLPFKRENVLQGDFSFLPSSAMPYYKKNAEAAKLSQIKKAAEASYTASCKEPVINNKVSLLLDEHCSMDIYHSLKSALKKDNCFVINDDSFLTPSNAASYAKELANSSFIIAAGEPYILRMLDIRPETKVIQAVPEIIPFYKKWSSSRAEISEYEKSLRKDLKIYESFDNIISSSPDSSEYYLSNYPMKKTGSLINIGSIISDNLFDKEYKRAAEKLLTDIIPKAKEKKRILFLLSERPNKSVIAKELLLTLHEDFAETHLCLIDSKDDKLIPEYMQGFAKNPRLELKNSSSSLIPLSTLQLISAADMIISDYDTLAYGAILCGKPLFIYAPDFSTYIKEHEAYFDFETLSEPFICRTKEELSEKMKAASANSKSVFGKKYEQFKDKYLKNCDGKASERLAAFLKNQF